MGKLQPNFSWQKYLNESEDATEQFQFQMQQEHIQVANTTNTTIDDLSYFLDERATSWAWVDTNQIYKKTLATVAWTLVGTVNIIPTGITENFTIIHMEGTISDGSLSSSNTLSLPHLDVTYGTGSVSIVRNGTNIVLTTSGDDRSAWSGFITIYYIKS